MKIPVEISARHIHLSKKDLVKLFGSNYQLEKLKNLSQPGEFASKQVLELEHKGKTLKARVVGPEREKTQVEISLTDALYLGLDPYFRMSGNVKDTPGIFLKNKNKRIKINQGVIVPLRHIHCSFRDKLPKEVSVQIKGKRELIFHKVKVRPEKQASLSLHLDTDEGNAAGIIKKGKGKIL